MNDSKFWSEVSYQIMREVDRAVTPLVGEKEAGETVKWGQTAHPPN